MLVDDFCVLLVPWFIVEDEFTSVDVWLALVELFVVFEPLPTFTPGLMLALALRSVFDTPTFAFTPTFGLTFSEELELEGLVLDDVPDVLPDVPEVLPDVPDVPDVRPEVPEVLDGLVLEDVLPEDDGLVDDVPLDDVPLDEAPRDDVPLPLTLPELLRLELPEV